MDIPDHFHIQQQICLQNLQNEGLEWVNLGQKMPQNNVLHSLAALCELKQGL